MIFLNLIFSFFTFLCSQDISVVSKDYATVLSSYTNKAAILYFESTEGITKDGVIFAEKLMDGIMSNGIKVVDPMIAGVKFKKFGLKTLGDMEQKNKNQIIKELGTDYAVMGSVSRIGGEVEIRGRIIRISDFEVLKVLTHRIPIYWADENQNKTLKKINSKNAQNLKTTEECKVPELVQIASDMSVSNYPYVCADFSCKMINCSKYPTAKEKIYKIYFKDPSKTVVVTDDFFNILEEYKTQ
ncbi:MAG: hypothetical protein N2Z60_02395 [Elusimicrobiales bacterium]|nr:hypothetical protein [Elusimicrobiales bacterium]HOJ86044.1 hypothetical protein [Elusimicrobiales bacterium]HOL62251.1 hypothetical protein [Elusimicrobiales bacterium]HPO96031.1 hypothetical protein [Elusimicrobiales bacterium]